MKKRRFHLIYDKEGAKRNSQFIKMHYEICEKMGIELELEVIEGSFDEKEYKLPDADAILVRTINPTLSAYLENNNLRVFNSARVSKIANDKFQAIKYMEEEVKIPVTPTCFFENRVLNEKLLNKYDGYIIKSLDGHGGKEVFRIKENNHYDILNALNEKDVIIQPYIECKGRDVRIYVIGKEIVGAVERIGEDGFKSNYSLGGSILKYNLSKKDYSYIEKIVKNIEFGMVGIDFLIKEDGNLIFNELEDVVGTRMFYKTYPNVNILEKYLYFVANKAFS